MKLYPNSNGAAEHQESNLRETWSDSARQSAAASRRSGGVAPANRKHYKNDAEFAQHKEFQRGRVERYLQKKKDAKTPGTIEHGRKEYIKAHGLKFERNAGVSKDYYKDPTGRLHIHNITTGEWTLGNIRRPQGKRRTAEQKRRDNYVMYD